MSASTKEVSVRFMALPSADQITQDLPQCVSIVSIAREAQDHPEGLSILGIYRNGVPLRHRLLSAVTLSVSPPLRLDGDRIEVRCLTPDVSPRSDPFKPLQGLQATYPLPHLGYGLQAPNNRPGRHP